MGCLPPRPLLPLHLALRASGHAGRRAPYGKVPVPNLKIDARIEFGPEHISDWGTPAPASQVHPHHHAA